MNIVDYIPIGSENAITRQQLVIRAGISDRKVREMINEARESTIILNLQDGKGYFRPGIKDVGLVEAWKKQEENRLKRHALALRAARNYLKGIR